MTKSTENPALKTLRSGKNIFLTGAAGTGKTYVLNQYIDECKEQGKQVLICATTGIAALNLNGTTMHQNFNIPIPAWGHYATELIPSKVKLAMTADVIIIDEISMCRADVFEYFGYVIDYVKKAGRNPQIIVSGDFYQLPPVVPEDDAKKLKYYGFDATGYCFTSRYWKKFKFATLNLTKIMRQDNLEFMENLGKLRTGNPECIDYFNQYVVEYPDSQDSIQICATNAAVEEINNIELDKLNTPMALYKATKTGRCAKEYPVGEMLVLKEGARVMFVVNDVIHNRYQNGTMGTVTFCGANFVNVQIDNGDEISVNPYKWHAPSEKVVDGKINKHEIGTFSQIPLRLSYGITMHKTQGQTYKKAIITPSSFADGQLYVALSRLTGIEGLQLTKPITENDIKTSAIVSKFYENFDFEVPEKQIEKRKNLDKAAEQKKKKKSKRKTTKKTSASSNKSTDTTKKKTLVTKKKKTSAKTGAAKTTKSTKKTTKKSTTTKSKPSSAKAKRGTKSKKQRK